MLKLHFANHISSSFPGKNEKLLDFVSSLKPVLVLGFIWICCCCEYAVEKNYFNSGWVGVRPNDFIFKKMFNLPLGGLFFVRQCPIFSLQPMSDQLFLPGWVDPLQGSNMPPNEPPLQRQHRLHVIIYHVQDHPDSSPD